MADKKISELESGQLTSPTDKLIFESASGSTKYVTVGALSGSQLNITPMDKILLQSGSTGTIGNIPLGAVGMTPVLDLSNGDSILIRSGTSSLPVNISYPVFLQLIRQAVAVNVSALYTVGSGAYTWYEISGGGGYECQVYCRYESGKRYTIDITPSETPVWRQNGVYVYAYPSESDSNLYLRCETVPGSITFRIVTMDAVFAVS